MSTPKPTPTAPPVVVLTDCHDANATARLGARIAALFGAAPTVLPLAGADPEGTAALTLLDVVQATGLTGGAGGDVVVLVNIAPRDGHWPNGAPFGFLRVGRTLVVSTYNPRVLAPLRRHLGVPAIELTDVRETVQAAADGWAEFAAAEVDLIAGTQFRSLWYQPLLARWVVDGRAVPARRQELPAPDAAASGAVRVAVVDNFGNLKLDRPAAEVFPAVAGVPAVPGPGTADRPDGETAASGPHDTAAAPRPCATVAGRDGRTHLVPVYDRLPDVPYGRPGLTIGSSGTGFAELVIRGGSAAEFFGFREGDTVFVAEPARETVPA